MLETMESTRLEVKVKPNARRNALTAQEDGSWLAEITALPVDGKANAALIALVAKHFGCPRRAVTVKRGATSRRKVLLVAPQR
jgi:uncharacterized protein YggU (UPF0235/DUF167 family)